MELARQPDFAVPRYTYGGDRHRPRPSPWITDQGAPNNADPPPFQQDVRMQFGVPARERFRPEPWWRADEEDKPRLDIPPCSIAVNLNAVISGVLECGCYGSGGAYFVSSNFVCNGAFVIPIVSGPLVSSWVLPNAVSWDQDQYSNSGCSVYVGSTHEERDIEISCSQFVPGVYNVLITGVFSGSGALGAAISNSGFPACVGSPFHAVFTGGTITITE